MARQLLAEPAVRAARRVALYAALPGELPLDELFEALDDRTERLLPRMRGERLEFAAVAGGRPLRRGRFGVLEPGPEARVVAPGAGDVVLAPGLAFDSAGHRLGRGGGHYDRALPARGSDAPLVIGVGFAFQLLDAVPNDSRDRPVDAIVTEEGLHWVLERR